MSIGLAIIADDYTGGLMVASLIEKLGISAPLVVDPGSLAGLGDREVVCIGTRLRFAPAAEAVAAAASIADRLDAVGVMQVYYKYCATFDSTDDGNIGPVADHLSARYGGGALLFCPALPDFRTTVYQGYMFYRDRLVSESIKRLDPITPMSDPDLVRVLQRQTRAKVGLLPHHVLRHGPPATERWLEAEHARGSRYVIMDAVDNDDIRTGAAVAAEAPFVTGGDALAIELARRRHTGAPRAARPPFPRLAGTGAAVLAGSCGPATLDQLAHFERAHSVLRLDLLDGRDPGPMAEAALAWAGERIGHGPVAITTAADPKAVRRAQDAFGLMGAARRAEQVLALIARGLFEHGIRRFLVAGGETAGAVVAALRVTRMQVLPADDLGPGACLTLEPAPMALFLKSGKLGPVNLFDRALERMAGT